MKRRHNILTKLLITTFVLIGALISIPKSDNIVNAASTDAYYTTNWGVNITGKSGDALRQDLTSITTDSQKKTTSYAELRTYTEHSDADPNNSGNIILFYSRASVKATWDGGTTWNREHVWPQNLSGGLYGESGAGSDIHHLRPADPKINSTRSNSPYGEVEDFTGTASEILYNNVGTGNYHIGTTVFEPRDDIKGDAARILMYLYTRYYDTGKLKITNIITTKSGSESAAWSLLLRWNKLDPVDSLEVARNNYIYTLQGNRNPFIDHYEFADMCFDSSYSGAGALLDDGSGSGGDIVEVTSISVNPSILSLKVNESKTLDATVLPTNASNKSVHWSSANGGIATVDANGTVKGISVGETEITAQAGSCTAKATVTIIEGTSGGDNVGISTQLTSINQIDNTKQYVLGTAATNGVYHYDGTSKWGLTAPSSEQTPLLYTLAVKDAANSTFEARTTISGTEYYLTVPSGDNNFKMETNTGETTILQLGSGGTVCSAITPSRSLRNNSPSGIRSYASATGVPVYFYEISSSSSGTTNQEKADQFIKRLTDLEGKVTLADEQTIQEIENDYAQLTAEVKTLVDNQGYANKLQELKDELAILKMQEAQKVIDLINTLPDPAILTVDNYSSYQENINAAASAYDALTEEEKNLVTNYNKLVELLNKLVELNPEPVVVTDTTFSSGSNLPAGWDGQGYEAFATSCTALKKSGYYLSYDLDSKKKQSVTVKVYSVTNSSKAVNEVTVSGLDVTQNAETVLSEAKFNPYSTTATNAGAVRNACTEERAHTINLQGDIDKVKITLSTRNANWVVYRVVISCVYAPVDTPISALDQLINKINGLSTCQDYAKATELREEYNKLSIEDRQTFDATICQEDSNCTLGQKLAYMEYMQSIHSKKPSSTQNVLLDNTAGNASLILIIGLMGIVSITGYYLINKRRLYR